MVNFRAIHPVYPVCFLIEELFKKITAITMASASAQSAESVNFGKTADVIFIFPANGGATVSAEKYKLMNSSEVFMRQFSSTPNDSEEASVRIAISDITFETFKELMAHIYEQAFDIDEDNFLQLLYASRKYFVNSLTRKVIAFAKKFINEDNVEEHFEFIEKFNIKMLNDHMKKMCIRSPLRVIGTLSTSEPHKRILKIILEAPYLPCTEYFLYEAVKRMFKHKENEKIFDNDTFRKELGNLVYLIRFPTMTITELIGCAMKPSPLTVQELIDLLLWVQEDIFSNTIHMFSQEGRLLADETQKLCLQCRKFDEVCRKCSKKY